MGMGKHQSRWKNRSTTGKGRGGGLWAGLLALALAANWAGAATLTARLERDTVGVGETVTLQLIFEGGEPESMTELKSQPDLRIEQGGSSRQYFNINGRASSQLIINYAVTPMKEGAHTIPAVSAVVGGRQIASQPVRLQAGKLDPALVSRQAFLKINLPKTNLYVGETILLEVELYAIAEQQGAPELSAAGFTTGKWLASRMQVVRIGAQSFARHQFSTWLTPSRPGLLAVGPVHFNARLPAPNARRSFFGDILDWRHLRIEAEAAPVWVRALPDTNVPPTFSGAVGAFSMSVSAAPTNVAVGDPVTVKIEIAGNTRLDTLRLPEQPGWKAVKVYPPTGKLENADQLGLGGRKYFEQVIVPQSTELRELPPFEFSFFDPAAGAYRTLAGPPLGLIVRPSAAAPAPAALEETNTVDIVHIKPRLGPVSQIHAPLLARPWFLALQLVPVTVCVALFARRRYLDRLAANPALRRRREADRVIERGLRELASAPEDQPAPDFYAAIFRLLQERLGERLGLPSSAITESVIEERLRPAGVEPELLNELAALFQACNRARYAQMTGAGKKAALLARAQQVLHQLATIEIRGGGAVGLWLAAGWLLGAFSLMAAPVFSAEFEAANKLYEQGRYADAIAAYEKLRQAGVSSPALDYNLGNACFKANQAGRAILAYRQALAAAPRDPDIRANLQFARRAVTGRDDAGPRGWRRWVGRLSLDEWTLVTMAAGWLWLGLLAARWWRPNGRGAWRYGPGGAGLVFLLAAACLGSVSWDRFGRQSAVVVARDVQARLGPFEESKAAFALPDGSELEVISTRDNWLEIRDPAKRAGWIKRDQVEFFPPEQAAPGQSRPEN